MANFSNESGLVFVGQETVLESPDGTRWIMSVDDSGNVNIREDGSVIPPSIPTDLVCTYVDSTTGNLTWTASNPGTNPIEGYRIFIDTVQEYETTNTYQELTLTEGQSYEIEVRAFTSTEESQGAVIDYTHESESNPPADITDFSASDDLTDKVTCTWTDHGDADMFDV